MRRGNADSTSAQSYWYWSYTFLDLFLVLFYFTKWLLTRCPISALPDFAILPNLNAGQILARRVNLVINPTIELLSSRAIQNIPNMLGYL